MASPLCFPDCLPMPSVVDFQLEPCRLGSWRNGLFPGLFRREKCSLGPDSILKVNQVLNKSTFGTTLQGGLLLFSYFTTENIEHKDWPKLPV